MLTFHFRFFGSLFAGKWAWQSRVPLVVWGFQTRPKSLRTGLTFWAHHYLEIMYPKFSGEPTQIMNAYFVLYS